MNRPSVSAVVISIACRSVATKLNDVSNGLVMSKSPPPTDLDPDLDDGYAWKPWITRSLCRLTNTLKRLCQMIKDSIIKVHRVNPFTTHIPMHVMYRRWSLCDNGWHTAQASYVEIQTLVCRHDIEVLKLVHNYYDSEAAVKLNFNTLNTIAGYRYSLSCRNLHVIIT